MLCERHQLRPLIARSRYVGNYATLKKRCKSTLPMQLNKCRYSEQKLHTKSILPTQFINYQRPPNLFKNMCQLRFLGLLSAQQILWGAYTATCCEHRQQCANEHATRTSKDPH